MIFLLLLALSMPQHASACSCPPYVQPWHIAQPPLGTSSPSVVPADYIESLHPPPGEWCYVGPLTVWVCHPVYHSNQCFGNWIAVRREPIPETSRWVVIDEGGENCLPCREECATSERIFSDGFETSDTSRWTRSVP